LFSLGDNSNDSGTAENYTNCYDPTWGRLKGRTHPVMGNHDQIADPQGGPYFAYFNGQTGDYGHYSLDLGSWHIIVLNSNCAVGGQGCGPGTPQETWLRSDLAATQKKCILAIWHTPLFTSGTQSPNLGMKTFWQDLYAAHADLILNGHNHNYERFAPQDPNAAPAADGIREFVVGTGGASLDPSSLPLAANEQVRSAAAYGYLKLTLRSTGYDWQFVAQSGKTFTDSGSAECH
jgi:calcineurin-like phosphoesterase family protein